MNTFYIVLLGIFGTATVVVPVWELVSKNKKLTPRGVILMISGIAIVIITIYKENLGKAESAQKDIDNQSKQKSHDSTMKAEFDSTINMNTRTYTEALAKYGLHFDSLNKNIEKVIKDSVNQKELPFVEIYTGPIDQSERKSDTTWIKVRVVNGSTSVAYNLTLFDIIVLKYGGQYFRVLGSLRVFPKKCVVTANNGYLEKLQFIRNVNKVDTIYFSFSGYYTNSKGVTKIPFKSFDQFIVSQKIWCHWDFESDYELSKFLKKCKIVNR